MQARNVIVVGLSCSDKRLRNVREKMLRCTTSCVLIASESALESCLCDCDQPDCGAVSNIKIDNRFYNHQHPYRTHIKRSAWPQQGQQQTAAPSAREEMPLATSSVAGGSSETNSAAGETRESLATTTAAGETTESLATTRAAGEPSS